MPKLTYLSHSGFILEGSRSTLIIDPFLSGNPLAKHKPSDLKADYVLLTHGHGDHLGDGIEIAKANNAVIIAPYELALYCEAKGASVHPMQIGGGYNFPFGRVKMTIAHHGSAAPDGTYTGNPCGYVVTMDEKVYYDAGDTGLFYDMKLIGELDKIDLATLPIGDNFTMGIDDAIRATEFLQPRTVIPMHYNTFDVIEADPADFTAKAEERGFNVKILGIGDSFEF